MNVNTGYAIRFGEYTVARLGHIEAVGGQNAVEAWAHFRRTAAARRVSGSRCSGNSLGRCQISPLFVLSCTTIVPPVLWYLIQ